LLEMEMPPTTRNVCVYVCEIYVNICIFWEKRKKIFNYFISLFPIDRHRIMTPTVCIHIRTPLRIPYLDVDLFINIYCTYTYTYTSTYSIYTQRWIDTDSIWPNVSIIGPNNFFWLIVSNHRLVIFILLKTIDLIDVFSPSMHTYDGWAVLKIVF
jgi:hypothetical protein